MSTKRVTFPIVNVYKEICQQDGLHFQDVAEDMLSELKLYNIKWVLTEWSI